LFCLKTRSKGLWVIFFYCISSLLTDVTVSSHLAVNHKYTIWNLYTLTEYAFLTSFFYYITKDRLIKNLLIFLFFIYCVVFFLLDKDINVRLNSVLSFISQFIILTNCLAYILSTMKQTNEPFHILNPYFVIVIAILLYVACTLFLFIIANQLSDEQKNEYWGITYFSNIITNLLFSASFLLYHYQRKSPPPENHYVDFTSPDDR
jgi:hypothetical protein